MFTLIKSLVIITLFQLCSFCGFAQTANDNGMIAKYTAAIIQRPADYLGYFNRGGEYYNQKEYSLAIADYTKAIHLKPSYDDSYYNRGLAYQYSGNPDKALLDFTKTLQLTPSSVDAHYHRGMCYHDKGFYSEAMKDFDKCIQLNPYYYLAYSQRAGINIEREQYEDALRDQNIIIAGKPDYYAYLNRGNTNYYKGDHAAAVADLKKALEYWPSGYSALYNLGVEYYNTGEHALAITEFKNATEFYPDSANSFMLLILSYIGNKQFEKARETYNYYSVKKMKSFITDPNYRFLIPYMEAATTYLYDNKYRAALPLLSQSLSDFSHSSDVRDQYAKFDYSSVLNVCGWVYEKLDSLEKAAQFYQKALVINPKNQVWINQLANLNEMVIKQTDKDKDPPEITLFTPKAQRGQDIDADADANNRIFISGSAKDKSGVKWVKVNGFDVEKLGKDGYFSLYLKDTEIGGQLLIQACDNNDNTEQGKIFKVATIQKAAPAEQVISPIPTGQRPVFHAVLIACSNYNEGGWAQLPSTLNEAKLLKKVLVSDYNFEEQNILELYDKTKEDILTALSAKLESLGPNDNLVILYSGHGTKEQKGSELIGYWVPLHATGPLKGYISNSELRDLIAGAKAKHILIMSDNCFSSAMRGNTADAKKEQVLVPYKDEYLLKSRRILTSGGLQKVPGISSFMKMVTGALEMNTETLFSEFALFYLVAPGVKNETGTECVIQDFGQDANQGGQFYFIRKAK